MNLNTFMLWVWGSELVIVSINVPSQTKPSELSIRSISWPWPPDRYTCPCRDPPLTPPIYPPHIWASPNLTSLYVQGNHSPVEQHTLGQGPSRELHGVNSAWGLFNSVWNQAKFMYIYLYSSSIHSWDLRKGKFHATLMIFWHFLIY